MEHFGIYRKRKRAWCYISTNRVKFSLVWVVYMELKLYRSLANVESETEVPKLATQV